MTARSFTETLARRGRTAAAWAACTAALVAATTAGFQAVDAWARPVFEARLQEWRAAAGDLGLGQVVGSVALTDGVVVRQDLDALRSGLSGVRLRVVTWHETPGPSSWKWTLVRHAADGRSREVVRRGRCCVAAARDWEQFSITFEPLADSFATRYTLRIKAEHVGATPPVGLPLYEPGPTTRHMACLVSATANAAAPPLPERAAFDLEPVYADPEG